jgi:hypothetical protein
MVARPRLSARCEFAWQRFHCQGRQIYRFLSIVLVMGRIFPQQLILCAAFPRTIAEKPRLGFAIHRWISSVRWRRWTRTHRQPRRRQIDRRPLGSPSHHQKLSGNNPRFRWVIARPSSQGNSPHDPQPFPQLPTFVISTSCFPSRNPKSSR